MVKYNVKYILPRWDGRGREYLWFESLFQAKCVTRAYPPTLTSSLFLQVCATLGTTGVCAFDCLSELGPICKCLPCLARKTSNELQNVP